ncbi:AAA domain-containing protein [Nostoc sp. 2RC]|uniref:AAA domain-containing protein n=1 Tax=Nostoc sp. 2RC TaxID=2485484 RepID=UPI0021AB81AD|nr:AAA domain-containing protein [Nostoc sp. 2RC]
MIKINQNDFAEIKRKVSEDTAQEDTIWVLSFPQLSTVNQGKSEYYPLFSLDVTSILKGEYQEDGWNLDNLELVEAGDNLARFLKLDDEQREQLNTQDGFAQFLKSTFGLEFDTYEGWMNQLQLHPYNIEYKPYLFKFSVSNFHINLKPDLKNIKSSAKNWFKSKHPAYEYLFGKPQLPAHKITYTGAFSTHPPTDSQLQALKHAQTEPITAVQGPPGSGKTTLILHVIAQQVVKRALTLLETGEDINNLTVVSSTVNKAVENVIEKLDEYLKEKPLKDKFFYLKGGSKTNIKAEGGAKDAIQFAIIELLDKQSFDENIYNSLSEEIKTIVANLKTQENHYINLRRQRDADEIQQPQLQKKIQQLEVEIESLKITQVQSERKAKELHLYEKLPIDVYQKIQLIFENARSHLPESNTPWWKRFILWLTRSTEQQILKKTASKCEQYILQTIDTPFPVKNPNNRSIFIQELGYVNTRIERTIEFQNIKNHLREGVEKTQRFTNELHSISTELVALENRLKINLKDFYHDFHVDYHEEHKRLFELSRQLLKQEALRNKEDVKKALTAYSNFITGSERNRRYFSQNLEKLEENLKAISLIFPVITSTLLSVKNMLPCVTDCIDRIIVDEAGMIPQHQTFPLLFRCRNAIIVGDPLQIEPIINLSNPRGEQYRDSAFIKRGLSELDYHLYSPEETELATTYHRAAGASGEDGDAGQGIKLVEHYRCQPSIIQFCDRIVGYGLQVKTKPASSLLTTNLVAYHVEGSIQNNVNAEEVAVVSEVIKHLISQGYSPEDIGVISPFSIHAQALKHSLPKQKELSGLQKEAIGTIHQFQGSQKRVIILSTKVCRPQDNRSCDWLNSKPNFLNVAVSRAEELFILVGNLYRLEKAQGYTRKLVEHIREHGEIFEYKSKNEIPEQRPGATLVLDCDHLDILKTAIDEAEEEITIVTPWIRGIHKNSEPERFAREIVSALQRGIKIEVIYGYMDPDGIDDNDIKAENHLRKLVPQYPDLTLRPLGKEKYKRSQGTNERILICDSKFAVVGSWNWLSHPYRYYCIKNRSNTKAQIRQETSIKILESTLISEIKNQVKQYLMV